jgi:hypothetical protein
VYSPKGPNVGVMVGRIFVTVGMTTVGVGVGIGVENREHPTSTIVKMRSKDFLMFGII